MFTGLKLRKPEGSRGSWVPGVRVEGCCWGAGYGEAILRLSGSPLCNPSSSNMQNSTGIKKTSPETPSSTNPAPNPNTGASFLTYFRNASAGYCSYITNPKYKGGGGHSKGKEKAQAAQLHAEADGLQSRLHSRSRELPARLRVNAALHDDLDDVLGERCLRTASVTRGFGGMFRGFFFWGGGGGPSAAASSRRSFSGRDPSRDLPCAPPVPGQKLARRRLSRSSCRSLERGLKRSLI